MASIAISDDVCANIIPANKSFFLALLLISIAILSLLKSELVTLNKKVLFWVLIFVLNGLWFIGVGLLNSVPGAIRVGTVYVLWPILFTIIIAAITGAKAIEATLRTIVVASVAVGMYMAMYFLYILGILPSALYLELDQGQAIGFHEGFVEFNMYSISTLIFSVPFLFAALLQWRGNYAPINKYVVWFAFSICFCMAILSGRRALWLLLIMTPLLYVMLASFQLTKSKPANIMRKSSAGILIKIVLVLVLLLIAAVAIFDVSLKAVFNSLIESIPDGSGEELSADLRFWQAIALIDGWIEKPWFGHGHGAVASIIRSEDMPWAYELTYLALLFHTGLVGTLIYAACVAWIYWQGVRIIRYSEKYSRLMLPTLLGTTSLLIANATNPYLAKFDFMWIIFVPLAIINCYLIERKMDTDRPCQSFAS